MRRIHPVPPQRRWGLRVGFLGLLIGGWLTGLAAAADLGIDPRIVYFPTPADDGTATPSQTVSITQHGPDSTRITDVQLVGPHPADYRLINDACGGQTLETGASCAIEVAFEPAVAGPPRAANLLARTDRAQVPELVAFLSNTEGTVNEARRRLPPVVTAIGLRDETSAVELDLANAPMLVRGNTYTIRWTLTGYHPTYRVTVAAFQCGPTELGCGSSYTNPDRVAEAIGLTPQATAPGAWRFNGVQTTEFRYEYRFSPDAATFAPGDRVILRLYQKTGRDAEAGRSSLSTLVPGGLLPEANYYDPSGRRLVFPVQ